LPLGRERSFVDRRLADPLLEAEQRLDDRLGSLVGIVAETCFQTSPSRALSGRSRQRSNASKKRSRPVSNSSESIVRGRSWR
jgi:hypothetical protein